MPSSSSSELFLVAGGTGRLGRIVAGDLVERGLRTRVLTRSAATARAVLGDGVEIAEGDLRDPASLAAAAQGVTRVFLLSPIGPALADDQIRLVDAAVAAGARRIVKLSGSHWTVGSSFSGDAHRRVEEHLAAAPVESVSIRPNAWIQVGLAPVAEQVVGGGAVSSRHGDARVSYIDIRDIADVALAQLLAPAVAPSPLVITGAQSLSIADIAAIATRLTGRTVSVAADAPPPPNHRSAYEETVIGQFIKVIAAGGAAGVTGTAAAVLGRAPRTVEAFLEERLAAAASEARS